DGQPYYGCDQDWYRDFWQRLSGCGPSVSSNLTYYLARAGRERQAAQTAALCPLLTGFTDLQLQQPLPELAFLRHMERLWTYVTPSKHGTYRVNMLVQGVLRLAQDRGLSPEQLQAHALEVPEEAGLRPSLAQIRAFLVAALSQDSPVAFLNLHNGNLDNLDSWHWTLITSVWQGPEPEALTVILSDSGVLRRIDLDLWLKQSLLGGGLAYFVPRI
ncbi:MAG: hypothetical protein PHR21_09360, partial [Oscillospiraceae bacterium]|nr:hypothetical protein [Oscillospiraceae bacterium]